MSPIIFIASKLLIAASGPGVGGISVCDVYSLICFLICILNLFVGFNFELMFERAFRIYLWTSNLNV